MNDKKHTLFVAMWGFLVLCLFIYTGYECGQSSRDDEVNSIRSRWHEAESKFNAADRILRDNQLGAYVPKITDPSVDEYGNKYWCNRMYRWHREDGPAIIMSNGTKMWYHYNLLHRKDGPAIERANGDKEWYNSNKRHRLDGPAIERADGTKEWWLDGEQVDVR
jgi:hypothetical protein